MICKVKSFLQVTEYTPPPIDISISFINLNDAISVEMLGLKPYCSSRSMSFLYICVNSLLLISFSETLEKEASKDTGSVIGGVKFFYTFNYWFDYRKF